MVHKCTLPVTEKRLGAVSERMHAIGARFFIPVERYFPFRCHSDKKGPLIEDKPSHISRNRPSIHDEGSKKDFSLNKGVLNIRARISYFHRYFKNREHGSYSIITSPSSAAVSSRLDGLVTWRLRSCPRCHFTNCCVII